ncbi:GMC oxidoreductase [Roseateles oligotrophus]|uniref:GMC family oxidoreductase n=1 Tax=Roseateles oligotrophus TaxID=1769250 RepID=A0ABT2YF93_9BURK|nr:GMC family oxidoreductase [Roseateles oligotrophus]MCV2368720.1 GMC family oxidoreductase [Roseateles oligotrophus]
MSTGLISLDDAANQTWDVIVVGTGIGGGTFGLAMAQAGRRVLFCERGPAFQSDPVITSPSLVGGYPEESMSNAIASHKPADLNLLQRGGRCIDALDDVGPKHTHRFLPFIGSGVGGSSALYGMAMERFFPSDFEPRKNFPNAANNTLPEAWPISYEELGPWYSEAESLYRVRGAIDTLRANFEQRSPLPSAPPLSAGHEWLKARLSAAGLSPYRLPMACDFVPGCQSCQGYLCPRACKNDSARICITPALSKHAAQLLANCRVTRLEASNTRVTGVVCKLPDGSTRTLRGDIVALAAGAMSSPALLLDSSSPEWPSGLANKSGLVGRNLMRHCIDLYAITPPDLADADANNSQKVLAFNDFYSDSTGRKLGSVQSFGRLPPVRMLFASLLDDIRHSPFAAAAPLVALAKPLLRSTLTGLEQHSLILASTMEDLPYSDNRITTSSDGTLQIQYQLKPHELRRVAEWRRLLATSFKSMPYRLLKQANNNQRLAHVCGTLRFGNSEQDSVLDASNRAHGLDNLFVVDASFFPSSGGTNPSLTIAANALRVAHLLTGSQTAPTV